MAAKRAKRWQVLQFDRWGIARLPSAFVVRGRTRAEARAAMRRHPQYRLDGTMEVAPWPLS